MQLPDKLIMLNITVQQAFDNVKSGQWTKASFAEWVEAHMDDSYDRGWYAGSDDVSESN